MISKNYKRNERPTAYVLFGSPGAGKGTQAELLSKIQSEQPGIPRYQPISTGEIFRALDPNSELGAQFAELQKEGLLVPDDLVMRVIDADIARRVESGRLNPQYQAILADGFPRTVEQARILPLMVNVAAVLYFKLSIKEAEERLCLRGQKAGMNARVDDNPEIIKKRMVEFKQKTYPILDFYRGKTRVPVVEIVASKPVEQVHMNVLHVLEHYVK
jgi:adenylate kinase